MPGCRQFPCLWLIWDIQSLVLPRRTAVCLVGLDADVDVSWRVDVGVEFEVA